ncbi:MAG: CDP-alcohol phosphatidyltransferase family protein [Chitinophagaceae bacterium]
MKKPAFYIINSITAYRLVSFPVLILLVIYGRFDIFKWMLGVSFFTDAIDGWLSRKFGVTSVFGSRLDSIGDDLTVLAGIIGVLVLDANFFIERWMYVAALLLLLLVQVSIALIRFRKLTSFHTYLAKIAAVAQGLFLLSFFFLPQYAPLLFVIAAAITALDLIEEIVMALLLPEWKADVKGLFFLKDKIVSE